MATLSEEALKFHCLSVTIEQIDSVSLFDILLDGCCFDAGHTEETQGPLLTL